MALGRGEAETTHPGLQQFRTHPFGSHKPPMRMSFAQENVAHFMRDDVPQECGRQQIPFERKEPDSAEKGIRHTAFFPCGSHHPSWKLRDVMASGRMLTIRRCVRWSAPYTGPA